MVIHFIDGIYGISLTNLKTVGLPALLENRIRTILSPGTLKLDEASQTFLFIIMTLLRHLFAGFEHAKVCFNGFND